MATPRQIIFDLETGKVLMWGYCVFQYDPTTQGVLENDTFVFREYAEGVDPDDPASERIIWYWNGEAFTQTPPN